MPTYLYRTIRPDGLDGELFEVVQRMSDPPLVRHPESGLPVERVPVVPNLSLNHSDSNDRRKLSDSNLDRLGFTKYVNAGDGKFEKTAGGGPSSISAD